MAETIESLLSTCGRVMPVVTLHDAGLAVPVAEALLAGGIKAMEITLRTSAGLEAIRNVSEQVKGMTVGAGTVISQVNFFQAMEAGAKFLISPALNEWIVKGMWDYKALFMPGVATPTEAMLAMEYGFTTLKFFPAELSGGTKMLSYYHELFPNIKFCPTGGISPANYKTYLAQPNVLTVAGTWLTPKDALAARDFAKITELAKQASA